MALVFMVTNLLNLVTDLEHSVTAEPTDTQYHHESGLKKSN